MKNPVTWFEIIGSDGATLHRFYREVFGWKLTPPVAEMGNYSMLAEHGPEAHGAGGGIGAGQSGESRVSIYVEVDEPQAYLERAAKAGAVILMPVTQVTPDTTIAMFRDPAGNVNGLLKASPHPAPRAPRKKAATRAKAPARTKKAAARTKKAARPTGRAKATRRRR